MNINVKEPGSTLKTDENPSNSKNRPGRVPSGDSFNDASIFEMYLDKNFMKTHEKSIK
jgi:hypothetical protein